MLNISVRGVTRKKLNPHQKQWLISVGTRGNAVSLPLFVRERRSLTSFKLTVGTQFCHRWPVAMEYCRSGVFCTDVIACAVRARRITLVSFTVPTPLLIQINHCI